MDNVLIFTIYLFWNLPVLGAGCCQSSIPEHLKSLKLELDTSSVQTAQGNNVTCTYAFLADPNTLDIKKIDLTTFPSEDRLPRPPIVLDWVVGERWCESREGNEGYACGSEGTFCSYSKNGRGFQCFCKEGFVGNPYHPQGCEGIFSKRFMKCFHLLTFENLGFNLFIFKV